jgi:hypothetical protein
LIRRPLGELGSNRTRQIRGAYATLESVDEIITRIETAFDDAPRPSNDALLHPECHDDMDLEGLRTVDHWRRLPDELVVSEYAALAFLSPAGFRHFIPAYMIWVLRHPMSNEAVVDSTVWAFHAELYNEGLRPFVRSKWSLLDSEQRDAVMAFLEVMVGYHADAERALAHWRG